MLSLLKYYFPIRKFTYVFSSDTMSAPPSRASPGAGRSANRALSQAFLCLWGSSLGAIAFSARPPSYAVTARRPSEYRMRRHGIGGRTDLLRSEEHTSELQSLRHLV